jgi:hypothetical protein
VIVTTEVPDKVTLSLELTKQEAKNLRGFFGPIRKSDYEEVACNRGVLDPNARAKTMADLAWYLYTALGAWE